MNRNDYTASLRKLADLLDEYPEIPLPYEGQNGNRLFMFAHDEDEAQGLRPVLELFPPTNVTKDSDRNYDLHIDVEICGLQFKICTFSAYLGRPGKVRQLVEYELPAWIDRRDAESAVEASASSAPPVPQDAA